VIVGTGEPHIATGAQRRTPGWTGPDITSSPRPWAAHRRAHPHPASRPTATPPDTGW